MLPHAVPKGFVRLPRFGRTIRAAVPLELSPGGLLRTTAEPPGWCLLKHSSTQAPAIDSANKELTHPRIGRLYWIVVARTTPQKKGTHTR